MDGLENEVTAVGELKIDCTASDNVNVAFYQNAVPIVRELAIGNGSGRHLSDISVHLVAEPAFLMPGVWRIDRIDEGATHHLRGLDVKLDPAFLNGVNASRRAQLRFRLESGAKPSWRKSSNSTCFRLLIGAE